MIQWDDVRYFLAVARGGSLRAGAERLGVQHSTVLRRLAELEDRLGVMLFDRLPSGYRITDAGEEVLHLAERMEAASHELEARVFGRDQRLRGVLRVTLPQVLATHLLMPDFAAFTAQHPEVEIELLPSHEPVNLTNREADVAIRVVYDRNALPMNLHGIAGPEVAGGIYLSRDLLSRWKIGAVERLRWVVQACHPDPDRDGAPVAAGRQDAGTQAWVVRGSGDTPEQPRGPHQDDHQGHSNGDPCDVGRPRHRDRGREGRAAEDHEAKASERQAPPGQHRGPARRRRRGDHDGAQWRGRCRPVEPFQPAPHDQEDQREGDGPHAGARTEHGREVPAQLASLGGREREAVPHAAEVPVRVAKHASEQGGRGLGVQRQRAKRGKARA